MSTLKVTNIQDTSGSNSLTTAQLYNGSAKAWVNFNGTGTVSTNQTIRASFNVSSVYKNGTGVYTMNFATAMVDGNYCACVNSGNNAGGSLGAWSAAYSVAASTASSLRVIGFTSGGSDQDQDQFMVAIFR